MIAQTEPGVKRQQLTEPFDVEAHWENTRFGINAVGALWQLAGIQKELRDEVGI